MTNVLILIDKLARAGAERLVTDIAPRIDRSRFQVTVCSLGKQTAMVGELEEAGVSPVLLRAAKWDPRTLFRIRRLVREKSISVIHAHLGKSIVLGWLAAKLAKVRFIAHEHVGPMWPHLGGGLLHRIENAIMCRATLFCMARSDAVIAVAGPTRDWIVAQRPKLAGNTVVITNGIDLDAAARASEDREAVRAEVRRELGLPRGCLLVLGVASFRFVKRWDLFVRCACEVLAEHSDVHFVGAGRGPLHDEMLELAATLGVTDNVHLIGVRGDIPRLMAAADLFLMPTSMECDPIVAKEALASGLPIVGSDIPALRENIVDGETGFLVTFGDVRALSEKVLEVLADDELRGRMSAAAQRLGHERFSIDACTRETEKVYERVAGGSGS